MMVFAFSLLIFHFSPANFCVVHYPASRHLLKAPEQIRIFKKYRLPVWVRLFYSSVKNAPLSYPLLGNTAMARGSSKLLLTSTLRLVPSRRATSMVLRPVSVQYMFLATQSTASPSVVFRPWLITVSMPLPSRFARLNRIIWHRVTWIKQLSLSLQYC